MAETANFIDARSNGITPSINMICTMTDHFTDNSLEVFWLCFVLFCFFTRKCYMTCKTYMKTSVLALIDTEKPVGNSTNYMELESNISVHENSYLVSLRMWTPLDLDHLVHICWQIWTPFIPPKKLFCLVLPPSCETVSSKAAKAT